MGREGFTVDTEVVLGLDESNELAGDGLAHVEELEKGVLTVCTWFTKVYLSNRVVYFKAGAGCFLSV